MPTSKVTIQALLEMMGKQEASDLHIKVGLPPVFRIGGHLRRLHSEPMSEEQADHLFDPILSEDLKERYRSRGSIDFAWHLPDGDRFRINVFRSGNHAHAAIRRVRAEIPSYADLHLPPIYSKLITDANQGLILICGVTGSGKSSTLAAMIQQVNHTRDVNIVTIEDPIEYRFKADKAIISQREIGIDVADFPTALRSVVRQDPDVIFIGEMRDAETILAGIQAAETGHLVFATLHTADTMQSLARMLEFFPPNERDFVRTSLANTLLAICAQMLLPATTDFETRVVPATEVLVVNSVARTKIADGADSDLPTIISSNRSDGMRSFNDSLAELVENEWVDLRTATHYSPNRSQLESRLRGMSIQDQTLA